MPIADEAMHYYHNRKKTEEYPKTRVLGSMIIQRSLSLAHLAFANSTLFVASLQLLLHFSLFWLILLLITCKFQRDYVFHMMAYQNFRSQCKKITNCGRLPPSLLQCYTLLCSDYKRSIPSSNRFCKILMLLRSHLCWWCQ